MKDKNSQRRIGVRCFSCCVLLSSVFFSLTATIAWANPPKPPEIIRVSVGLANRYKAGSWTQVEVTLRGGDEPLAGELAVIVPDGDGVPGQVATPSDSPCQVLPGRETVVRLITRFGRVDSELTAEFRVGGKVVASRVFRTSPQADGEHFLPAIEFRKLVVAVGGLTLGVEEADKLGGDEQEERPVIASLQDVERLPTNWCGYEGVDAVVLSTSQPEIYRKLTVDDVRMQALDQWIRMGGRLVLCVGSRAEEILAADSPLRRFVPGRLEKMVSLRRAGALETYSGGRSSVRATGRGKIVMRVPRLADIQGIVEASEADLPLVVRTARGFGQILFIAADLDRPPLVQWPDRSMLMAKLLNTPSGHVAESRENTAMMHHGYGDLSGQLRSALDRFTGVRLVPFWVVAGLIFLYILLVGPGDYFFLRKVVGRMGWTWLTFSLIVVLVSLAAYVLAYRFKGDQFRVNQVDLVDVDVASGQTRGATWLNVFSPRMESFNFTVQPQLADGKALPDARVWMAWLGLPGGGLGGMNPRAGGPLLWTEPFCYAADLSALYAVPVQVWSTKSLTARWAAPAADCPVAELAEADQLLSGSITNTLSFPLDECLLAHGRSVYDLGALTPGKSTRIGPMSKRSELKTLLTGRKVVVTEDNKYRQETTPYDQSSTNLPYILRTMMFYEAAGGQRYTGLKNDYQGFVDLSALLKADRAILIALGPSSGGEKNQGAVLLRNGKPLGGSKVQHTTMYRFVFPVKREDGG